MKIKETFLEGKTKKLYTVEEPDQLIMEFLDVLPQSISSKGEKVKGKGAINAEISAYLFQYLTSYNVPTHFVRKLDDKSILVRKAEMFDLKMVIWNYASGTLSKRLGLKEGTQLETPVLELYLKNSKLKYPLINDYHAYALGLCERSDMNVMIRIGTKVNAVLKSFFLRKHLTLAHFTMEFGKVGNQVLLADEISPDTFTVWDNKPDGTLDRKVFTITPQTAKTVYPAIKERLIG